MEHALVLVIKFLFCPNRRADGIESKAKKKHKKIISIFFFVFKATSPRSFPSSLSVTAVLEYIFSSNMSDQAAQFKAKGNEFFKAKDYSTAIEWYTKAVDADPQNRVYYSNRSAAYSALRDYEAAAKDGEMCIRCDPDWNKGYFRHASALQGLKRYQEALKVVNTGLSRRAVSDDKSLVGLRDTLAPLAERQRQAAMANMANNQRLKEEGNAFFKQREYMKAIEKYQAAIDDPSTQNGDEVYISCYNNMAGAKQQLHDHKGVVEASSMVLEVSVTRLSNFQFDSVVQRSEHPLEWDCKSLRLRACVFALSLFPDLHHARLYPPVWLIGWFRLQVDSLHFPPLLSAASSIFRTYILLCTNPKLMSHNYLYFSLLYSPILYDSYSVR